MTSVVGTTGQPPAVPGRWRSGPYNRAIHAIGEDALKILTYPHPTLRHRSQAVRRVDAELHSIVAEMFRLMYEARGVGLAANQVDLPLRLFVANLISDPEEGEEYVFINPVIDHRQGMEEREEGCLSLPELYGKVKRPESITVNAYDLHGQEVTAEVDGLFARVIQHETDHLDGVLFIDRLSETGRLGVDESIAEFEFEFNQQRERGELPDDAAIAVRLAALERKYC